MFAVKKEQEDDMKCLTPNIVYREVLLHRGHRLTPTTAAHSPPTLTVPEHVNDIESIYDGFEEEESNVDLEEVYGPGRTILQQSLPPNLSRPLPVGVIPAALPSREEAEVDEIAADIYVSLSFVQASLDLEDRARRHEAWIASLPTPTPAPPTAAEEERLAMIARRQDFLASLVENPLTEETLARARDAHIFIT